MSAPTSPTPPERLRALAAVGLWLTLALLPFGAAYEVGCALCLLAGGLALWHGWRPAGPGWRCFVIALSAYGLAAAWSLPDAVDPQRALTTTISAVRFIGYGLAAAMLAAPEWRALTIGCGLLVLLWTLDALLQAATGLSLGGSMDADRLSGIFGADDLKLGPTLAACAPLLLAIPVRCAFGLRLLAALLLAIVVLLAGARAGWISFAVVLAWWLWRALHARGRRVWPLALSALAVLLVLGGLFYAGSARFQERVDRTLSVLSFDRQGLDRALAWRLPIFENAVAMAAEHPFNGVGVRGFRIAYLNYADLEADRHVLMAGGKTGAFHPHQLLLELLTETGWPGLLLWLAAAFVLLRAWRRAAAPNRQATWPFAAALAAMVFPLNTHLAFYSSFWGSLFCWLLALYCARLALPPAARPTP